MKRLKFVWGTILCQMGSVVMLLSIISIGWISDAKRLFAMFLGGGVGTFNMTREIQNIFDQEMTQNWIFIGIAIAMMGLGSFLIYLSDDTI